MLLIFRSKIHRGIHPNPKMNGERSASGGRVSVKRSLIGFLIGCVDFSGVVCFNRKGVFEAECMKTLDKIADDKAIESRTPEIGGAEFNETDIQTECKQAQESSRLPQADGLEERP